MVSGQIVHSAAELIPLRLVFSGTVLFRLSVKIYSLDGKGVDRTLDTFDSALNIHILYHYMVSNYLNVFALAKPTWFVFPKDFSRDVIDRKRIDLGAL